MSNSSSKGTALITAPLGASELSMQTVSQNGDTTLFSSHAARSHSKRWLRASQARADGISLPSWRTSTTRRILEGTVTFSIDGDVFNASVGSIVVIPGGAHHAWRNHSNAPIRMSTFFSQGGVEELYPKLVGLSLEELPSVVEPIRFRHCWAAHR